MESQTNHLVRRASAGDGKRLKLGDVTVCAADTLTPALAARALEICLDQCEFGDAILFTDVAQRGRFRNVKIPKIKSVDEYSLFCLRDMTGHINTEFALVVQWDGYVIDTSAWAAGFRRYDYIGAPIPSKTGPAVVGNGGFSWRSRKLMQALPGLPLFPGLGEDWIISSVMRHVLEEEFDIHFAPIAMAERFSHEIGSPRRPTFGFHGVPNLALHENDAAVMEILSALPRASLISRVFFVLLFNCQRDKRTSLAAALYALVRTGHEQEWLITQMSRWADPVTARSTITTLERASASIGVQDVPRTMSSSHSQTGVE